MTSPNVLLYSIAVACIVIAIFVLFHIEYVIKKRQQFAYIFGFYPRKLRKEDRVIDQKAVAIELARRARNFKSITVELRRVLANIKMQGKEDIAPLEISNLWREMEEFLARYDIYPGCLHGIGIPDSPTLNGFVAFLEKNVERSKKDFWEAHNLAKHFGYEVMDTFKEHILPVSEFAD